MKNLKSIAAVHAHSIQNCNTLNKKTSNAFWNVRWHFLVCCFFNCFFKKYNKFLFLKKHIFSSVMISSPSLQKMYCVFQNTCFWAKVIRFSYHGKGIPPFQKFLARQRLTRNAGSWKRMGQTARKNNWLVGTKTEKFLSQWWETASHFYSFGWTLLQPTFPTVPVWRGQLYAKKPVAASEYVMGGKSKFPNMVLDFIKETCLWSVYSKTLELRRKSSTEHNFQQKFLQSGFWCDMQILLCTINCHKNSLW